MPAPSLATAPPTRHRRALLLHARAPRHAPLHDLLIPCPPPRRACLLATVPLAAFAVKGGASADIRGKVSTAGGRARRGAALGIAPLQRCRRRRRGACYAAGGRRRGGHRAPPAARCGAAGRALVAAAAARGGRSAAPRAQTPRRAPANACYPLFTKTAEGVHGDVLPPGSVVEVVLTGSGGEEVRRARPRVLVRASYRRLWSHMYRTRG